MKVDRIHVAHLSESLSSRGGGISVALRGLSESLQSEGADQTVISFSEAANLQEKWGGNSPLFMRAQSPFRAILSENLDDELLRGGKMDLLHTHGLWTALSVIVPRVSGKKNIPWIVSPHGMLDSWALKNSGIKKRIAALIFENKHLREASCLHALCEAEAGSMRDFGLKNPICVIPNGVHLPREEGDVIQADTRKKRMLFLGRLHPKKGLLNALRAWKIASDTEKCEEWQFVIAGWDQYGHESELKRLCDELDLVYADLAAGEYLSGAVCPDLGSPASVIFIGSVFGSDKDALYRNVDAFILPSYSEGLPMSILEAWSYRLPVIMTDHCNLPEGFAANAACRIGTDVQSISEGIRKLIKASSVDLQVLSENGFNLVESRFTWQQVAEGMQEVYEWVLGGGPSPSCVLR